MKLAQSKQKMSIVVRTLFDEQKPIGSKETCFDLKRPGERSQFEEEEEEPKRQRAEDEEDKQDYQESEDDIAADIAEGKHRCPDFTLDDEVSSDDDEENRKCLKVRRCNKYQHHFTFQGVPMFELFKVYLRLNEKVSDKAVEKGPVYGVIEVAKSGHLDRSSPLIFIPQPVSQ